MKKNYTSMVIVKNLHTDEIETFIFTDKIELNNFCVYCFEDYEIISIKKC